MALSGAGLVAVDALAWLGIHGTTGYAVHRLPVERLSGDGWLWSERRWEAGGAWYVRRLRIKRWKHRLPEAGAVFAGGFDKRHLRQRDAAYLNRYAVETRRAELGHWLAAAPAPLFFLWNPWCAGLVMLVYAVGVNGPCIAAQRYNRIRIERVRRRGLRAQD